MYFGVGAKVPSTGEIIPVQTYKAMSQLTVHVFPQIKYYVAYGNYQPGSIVNLMTLARVLTVDFTGCKDHSATFTLNEDNFFIPDREVQASDITWSVGSLY
ncbi:hypothetical protein FPOAC2_04354 [Fusarium poae]